MKKSILFIAAISALSFASCKKDRTCTCTTTVTSGSTSNSYTEVITITKAKKGDAKKMCIDDTQTSSDTFGGVTTTTTYATTCKLK